jgi:hypothetical protein
MVQTLLMRSMKLIEATTTRQKPTLQVPLLSKGSSLCFPETMN